MVHLHGDLVVPRLRELYAALRGVARQRGISALVLDFSDAGRIDSSGVAVISLLRRQLAGSGKQLDLAHLGEQHRAALALAPGPPEPPERQERPARSEPAGRQGGNQQPAGPERAPDVSVEAQWLERPGAPEWPVWPVWPVWIDRFGARVIDGAAGLRAFAQLAAATGRQLVAVIARRARMPAGALHHQIEVMGADGIFVVALLSFLTGMTMAFQGAVQLQRFGAGVFVADLIGMSMVRELVPLMTAVIITGRTGAAIAAELGTMRAGSEIDALLAMGIDPVRFLVVPRMIAIIAIGPALTLIGIFVGVLGGMLVAAATLDMPPVAFWSRVVDRVTLGDFAHGLGKSVVFACIIGLTASHLGMRARGDAGSVGTATTRTVVISVFSIVLVDALFATITTFTRYG